MSTTRDDKRRNLNQASKMDAYNDQLTKQIMTALAPSGFQAVRGVDVSIRERLTKKECMDIAYDLLLKTARLKVDMLRAMARESATIKAAMAAIESELQRIEKEHPTKIGKVFTKHSALMRDMRHMKARLDAYNDMRMIFLPIGPTIPDDIMKEQKL